MLDGALVRCAYYKYFSSPLSGISVLTDAVCFVATDILFALPAFVSETN